MAFIVIGGYFFTRSTDGFAFILETYETFTIYPSWNRQAFLRYDRPRDLFADCVESVRVFFLSFFSISSDVGLARSGKSECCYGEGS
jgi:hypothetical protein